MRAAMGQLWRRPPPVWKALASLAAFSALGGVGGAMLTGEPLVGAAAYYALAVLGLCSPQGAVLRQTFRRDDSGVAASVDANPAIDQ